MKYIIDVTENKSAFAEEFFKSVSFIKNVKVIQPSEITNPLILKGIEDYEQGNAKPTPMSLSELKTFINS